MFFILKFCIFLLVVVNCQKNMMESLKKNRKHFRIGRLNEIWSRAVELLHNDKEILNFYGDLALQDLLVLQFKHKVFVGDEEDESEEDSRSHLDRKLLDILLQYGLKDLHLNEIENIKYKNKHKNKKNISNNMDKNINNNQNNIDNNINNIINNNNKNVNSGDDEISDSMFEKMLKQSPRLHHLWLRAHGGVSEEKELLALKIKLQSYLNKLSEYDELLSKMDGGEKKEGERGRMNEDDGKKNEKMEKSRMEVKMKEMYEDLKRRATRMSGKGRDNMIDRDHRLAGLWKLVLKANLSDKKLQEVQNDLKELTKHIKKHDFFFKEAQKLKVMRSGEEEEEDEDDGRLEKVVQKVELHDKEIKSWHSGLKSKLQGKRPHTDL